jgi:hypothetical protein
MLPAPVRGEEDSYQIQLMLVSIASLPHFRVLGKVKSRPCPNDKVVFLFLWCS